MPRAAGTSIDTEVLSCGIRELPTGATESSRSIVARSSGAAIEFFRSREAAHQPTPSQASDATAPAIQATIAIRRHGGLIGPAAARAGASCKLAGAQPLSLLVRTVADVSGRRPA